MNRRVRLESQATEVPSALVDAVNRVSRPLEGAKDLDPLIERIGDARFVLLGEASHGTADYYRWRAELSKRLIREKGFSLLAVEGDWPDCFRVNRYVCRLPGSGQDARQVLHAFERWPTWMWANEEIIELTEWLHEHNRGRPESEQVGFYGLDVYSLWDSLSAITDYLHRVDPASLPSAWRAYRCFEPYGEDVERYARETALVPDSCQKEVLELLRKLQEKAPQYRQDGREAYFQAEQNAVVLKNAESYYRAMLGGGAKSWNIRDQHMMETLDRLMAHHGPRARAIVWEHNTHIGDARYTDMVDEGMFNVGQLVRERHEREGVVLVGFSSHHGSVTASKEWEAPMERMEVPPGREGTWEDVLHRAGESNKLLIFDEASRRGAMAERRGHRAIGVVYHPEYERYGNYVPTVLPLRYDALLYIDETEALHPLHMPASRQHEVPETYPSGV